MYEPRTYREWVDGRNLTFFRCGIGETDLHVGVDIGGAPLGGASPGGSLLGGHVPASRGNLAAGNGDLLSAGTLALIREVRGQLESYIRRFPEFATSLTPLEPAGCAPVVVMQMCAAARQAGVGPMAAVAGAVSEFVGLGLLCTASEVIVENGGDIFLKTSIPRRIGVFAGLSPFSGQVALLVQPEQTPLGICTSSGRVGHSLSFGQTDATVVLARDTALADAAATAVANRVRVPGDIPAALDFAAALPGIAGGMIIIGEHLAAWGEVCLVER